jgi:radical SAM superfamily enzyme YgiQ (UPF0313 family)
MKILEGIISEIIVSENVEYLSKKFNSQKIKKVLLIQPPDTDSSTFNYGAGKRGRLWNYPPYGLGLLASQLRLINIEVDILNLNNKILEECFNSSTSENFNFDITWKSSLKEKIENYNPDFIGLTSMFSQSHEMIVQISNYIHEVDSKIVLGAGGVHITNSIIDKITFSKLVEDLKFVDYFFLYESDLSFINFIKVCNDPNSLSLLGQITIRVKKDVFVKITNRLSPETNHLNTIPAIDLMEVDQLSQWGKIGSFFCLKPKNSRMTTILSNRGCRAQCTFCSVRNFNGVGVRRREVSSVIEELKILKNDYNIDHVMWLDDDFLYDEKESMLLFNEMVKNKLNMTWDCSNGVIAFACKDEIIHAAQESGCIGVNIGMESGNRDILKSIKKPGTVENFLAAAEVFKKYSKINARVFLMIGFPKETYRQILDTIDIANKMDLDWYNVTILQPLPNTPIFNTMIESGLIDPKKIKLSEIRYNAGGLGKHSKKNSRDFLSVDFKEAFSVENLDDVPPQNKLDDIWAYMNYHLNFKRLVYENRESKIHQKFSYVKNITDLVAPENCIALYFLGYLENKLFGKVDIETINNLEKRLIDMPYWQNRFDEFNLSIDHLKKNKFNFL